MNQYPLILGLLCVILFPGLKAADICPSFSCNRHRQDPILFPFRVPENQTIRCGYPGFELSCNFSNDQTLLFLSSSPLIVQAISYPNQILLASDPNRCIPKRVMDISLNHTPYSFGPYGSTYTFLNCSGTGKQDLPRGSSVISCMSEGNYTVVATLGKRAEEEMLGKRRCKVMKRVNAAFWWIGIQYGYYPKDISDVFVQLGWEVPSCGECMDRGGSCGLVGDYGLEVACFLPDSSGIPKSAKYVLLVGAGIPVLVCLIGLTFFISSRLRSRRNSTNHRRRTNTESSPSIFPQPIVLTLGLDEPTIESYPKTTLGESKRLPKPSDNTCPICLSEYQPKETLRSIPDCKHYFHADCIDEWLRMNATCPFCRNSPQQPSPATSEC